MTSEQRYLHERNVTGSPTAVQWPEPDTAFAPPPDDLGTDEIAATRGIALALVIGGLFWAALVAWVLWR
jgi:hypothetical protein